jgi:hypothetical protein
VRKLADGILARDKIIPLRDSADALISRYTTREILAAERKIVCGDALRRRDVFVAPSWRYTDPRSGLLAGSEWEAVRPIVCRSLGYTPDAEAVVSALAEELDQTYCHVVAQLPDNPAVTIESIGGKDEICLSALDKIDDPPSLTALRDEVEKRMPRAELPEIMLEIAVRTGFTQAFTHINDRNARAS